MKLLSAHLQPSTALSLPISAGLEKRRVFQISVMMFSLAIGRVQRLLCPLFVPCSAGGGINFEQVRWRKRNASKPLSKHERAERKRKREERLAERKKHSFMQRIQIARMKSALSPSQQHPGRYDAEAEKDLPAEPTANVFFTDWCRTQFYTVGEALRMHRIAQCPAVFNNPSAFVRLRVELNMSTEKTTKMLPNSDELVRVPFPFDHKQKRAILAFAPTKQLQEGAVEAGAELAIGKEMVKKIVKGEFRTEDFDFCVAHSELEKALVPLKSTLRSRYPTRDNGALGDDLPSLIASFIAGIKLSIRGDPVYPIWGLSDVVVGKLNMPDEHLESNIEEIVRSLCRHRNPALGPFINRANLMVIPGNEFYALKVDQWCPQPTEEQIEKLLSRKRKKKTKPTPTEEDEDEEEDPLISLM